MGTLRLLLAIAVVVGHSGQPGMLTPYYCVQAFFVISGFYMALVWKKYEGQVLTFYVNRYSRLAASYWIVAAVTLAFALRPTHPALVVPNTLIFGMDLVEFFSIDGRLASDFLLVPQGWSLGAELWFYLLVPLLVPLRTRALCALLAATIALRFAVVALQLPFFPWQQRLFPAELAFFLTGILAYRHGPAISGPIAMVLGAGLICFAGRLPIANDPNFLGSALLAAFFFAIVPSAFNATHNSAIDRFVGEFSYPVYLWHIFVIFAIGTTWAVPLSIAFAAPLVLFVELPLERWRTNRMVKPLPGTPTSISGSRSA